MMDLKPNKFMVFIAVTYVTLRLLSRSGNFDPTTLKGQNVIVTGASSGIGREMALMYCRMGANVFITARREQLLEYVIDECEEKGDETNKYGFLAADMSKEGDPEKVIEAAVQKLGGIDQLILNHAYIPLPDNFMFTQANYTQLQTILQVNLFAFIRLTGHAMPFLRESKGRIGIVSSAAGRIGSPFMASYAASKFAIDGFFSSLDMENFYAKNGVSITIAFPGMVDTGALDGMELFEEKGFDVEKLKYYMPPGDAAECAWEVIRHTTMRSLDFYYPPKQKLALSVLIKHIYPSALRTNFFMKTE